MDNTLYVGLSRQMTLRRELDIVANNIANADTAGFKVESLMIGDRAARARRTDAQVPHAVQFVLDHGVARDFGQGALKQTGASSTSPSRARASSGPDRRRRALHPRRPLQHGRAGPAGHPGRRCRCWARAAARSPSTRRRAALDRRRRHGQPGRRAGRQARRGPLRQPGGAVQGRRRPLPATTPTCSPRPRPTRACARACSRPPTSSRCSRSPS